MFLCRSKLNQITRKYLLLTELGGVALYKYDSNVKAISDRVRTFSALFFLQKRIFLSVEIYHKGSIHRVSLDKLKHTGHVKVLSKTPITDDYFLFDECQLESRRHSGLQLANVY